MTDGRRLIPQPGERWLLRDGGRCYAVPASLGRRLRDGEDVPGLDDVLEEGSGPAAGRTLWLGLPLLPAGVVVRMAHAMSHGTSWPALGAAASVGCAAYAAAWNTAGVTGFAWPIMIVSLLAAGLIHELGHAAALSYGGVEPGAIGVGALFVFPVLFCDVTAVALLPKPDRVRVDVAGLAWHLAAGGVMALAGACLDAVSLTMASWGVLAAIVWSLMPFLRTDGYWLLCDLLGLSALETPAPPNASRRLRTALIAWRLGSLLFLGVIAMALIGRARWLMAVSEAWRVELRVGVLVAAGVLAGMVTLNLVKRGAALMKSLWSDSNICSCIVHTMYL